MVQYYILNYHSCRHAKAPRDWYNSLLKSLILLSCPWPDVIFDFIIGLPISNGYNIILIVVDCLTKKRYYIPYSMYKNGTTIEATIQLLFQNVRKLYGLPLSLTLDRGSQFISRV